MLFLIFILIHFIHTFESRVLCMEENLPFSVLDKFASTIIN